MAVEIINANKQISFDCVDIWKYLPTSGIAEADFSDLYVSFLKNIEPVREQVTPVRALSVEAAQTYGAESLDFVFIDAGHEYESVCEDLNAWFPKLKNTGVIAGHDYTEHHPGVVRAVNEFFQNKRYNIISRESCWFVDLVCSN
jgi:cobalamin biosynthesis Co2+ chelatase CbiK